MEGGATPGPGFGGHRVGPEAGGNAAALGRNPGHVEAHAEGEEDGDHVEEAGGQRAGVERVLAHGLQREEVRGQQEEQPKERGRPGAAQQGPQAGHGVGEGLLQPVQVRAVAEEWACGGRGRGSCQRPDPAGTGKETHSERDKDAEGRTRDSERRKDGQIIIERDKDP